MSQNRGRLVEQIRSISGAFSEAVARMPDQPNAAKAPAAAPTTLSFADRARYYCAAVLIQQASASGAGNARELAERVAPGDPNLREWLGIRIDREPPSTPEERPSAVRRRSGDRAAGP